jgi:hypothetical protein
LPANALTFYPLAWALVALVLLRLTERWIHRHLQQFGFQLTGNQTVALVSYAILLFPGVVLHELSHWLFARLLGIRTGRISLLPARGRDGQLQLGSVEYQAAGLDPVRESLVGGAPLIAGCAALFLIANHLYGIPVFTQAFASGELQSILDLLAHGLQKPDFWLWFYLIFTIANAMMPSAADRRAWPAFLAILALGVVVLLILGLGDWLLPRLAEVLVALSGYLATTLTLTIGVNLLILGGLATGERLLRAAGRA